LSVELRLAAPVTTSVVRLHSAAFCFGSNILKMI
jgi:hypothetical protein